MIKRITLALVLTTLFSVKTFAQKNLYKEAEKAYENKEYFSAIDLYKKAYTKAKKAEMKAKILFRTAESYRHINHLKEAETFYSKAINAKYPDPISYYYIGLIKKENMLYNEAITEFQNYKKEVPSAKEAEDQIKSCELAQKWKDAPTRHRVENMALINSKEEDFSPSYEDSKKYNKLVFVSTREGSVGGSTDMNTGLLHEDLFETTLDKNGKWSTPITLPEPVNSKVNEGPSTFSRKGDFMIFTRCEEAKNQRLKCHLYLAKKSGPNWNAPEKLPFNVDSLHFAHPTISADGNTLYFASDAAGGFGKTDIWKSTYDKKSKSWGTPENCGPGVNSAGNEQFPFIHTDGKTLYFASDGWPGMGGFDIFKSKSGSDGKFTGEPENLKYPLNSPHDDFGIIFEGNKDRGYLTSNREGGKGSDDIWSFVLPPLIFKLEGLVTNAKTGTPVPNCPVKVLTPKGVMDTKTDGTGAYKFNLEPEMNYEVYTETGKEVKTADAPDGFLNNSDRGKFTTVGENDSKTYKKDFALVPVEKEIHMPQILYDLGKATLRPESKDSLNYLYNLLIQNPTIICELSAHTDSRGSTPSNDKLSQARAESCVNYLVQEKGIPAARLVPKGWGERKLLIKDDVIKKEKTKEGQEALHQKNRRTVFRILSWDYIDPNKPNVAPPAYHPKVTGEEDSSQIQDNPTE